MKKSLTLIWVLFALILGTSHSFAQGLSLGQVSGLVGDTVSVPVTVTGASPLTVSAMTLGINYDSTRIRCLATVADLSPNVTSANLLTNAGNFSNTGANLNATASQFRLAWYDLNSATVSGVLFNIRVVILRSGPAPLTWDLATPSLTELADFAGDPIAGLQWTNGSVNGISYPSLTIGSISGRVGDTVSVPVTMQMDPMFSVAAISMAVNYDSTRIRCAGDITSVLPVLSSSLLGNCGVFPNLGPNYDITGTQFRAGWFDVAAVNVNGLMFNMRFVILQSGPTSLSFDLATPGNCELADSNGASIANVQFNGGVVTGNLGNLSIPTRFKAVAEDGTGAFIPVTMSNVAPASGTGSFKISLVSSWSNGTSADLVGWQDQRITVTNAQTAIQIPIAINNDAIVEDDEYLVFRVDSLEGLTLTGSDFFTYYITDNDRQAPVTSGAIQMTALASFDPTPGIAATTEVVAYDALSKRAFLSSAIQKRFDIVSLNNPAAPVTLNSVSVASYGGITGLAVKPGLLAVASPAEPAHLAGKVLFFDTLGTFKGQVTVGALPDMITFTGDGKFLLTANEGQPQDSVGGVDPEGSVSIIDVQDTNYVQSDVTTLTFTGFNALTTALTTAGVRKGSPFGTLSQNLEPEYITVSADNTKAWVTLQENNAIAQIDLVNKIVNSITPMGMKNHQTAQNGFDASDNNGQVLLTNWPVKSYYMPDAIASYAVGSTTYLVTANEGDEREYSFLNERTTVGAVTLDATRFPNGAMLKETHALGRLRITNQSGDLDGDGDYDELHMVGPRSFSIWNAATGALVFDSKNLIENIVLADPVWGALFNADSENNTRKNRSRAKGPEPEGVALGRIGTRWFAFIALERVGGVMAFEVTNPAAPVFTGYLNTRSATSVGGDRGAEVIQFLGSDLSPNGKPMLLVANEISGTLAMYQVNLPALTLTAPANITVAANQGCTAVGIQLGTAVDAGGFGSRTVVNNAPVVFPVGATNVTWTVTDQGGQSVTAVQVVTVTDSVKPTIILNGDTVTVNATSCADVSGSSVNLGTPAVGDNCGIASVTNNAPSVYPVGNTTVTWTVTDVNGNTNSVNQVVVVNSPPAATGLQIGQVSGLVGDTVMVPVRVNPNECLTLSALTLAINYDSTRLRCLSQVTNWNSALSSSNLLTNCGFFAGTGANLNVSASQFRLAWYDLNPATVSGLLFNIPMVVLRAGTSSLSWDLSTPALVEVGDANGNPIPGLSFANGGVQGIAYPSVSLANVSGRVGDTVSVPVTVQMDPRFTVGAISLAVNYDSTRIRCAGDITSVLPVLSGALLGNCGVFTNLGPNYNITGSQFRAGWFDPNPVNVNGLMFNMRFVILQSGPASLSFDLATPGLCDLADSNGTPIANVQFNGGVVTGNLGTIAFGSRFKNVSESGSGAFIPVTMSNVAPGSGTGSFKISLLSSWSNGTSADLSGWQDQRITVTNAQTAIQIPIAINNDATVEDDEYLVFKVDSLEGLTLTGSDFFTYYINDDDRTAPAASGAVTMTPLASFDPTPGQAATTEVVAYDPISKRAFLSSAIQRRFDIVSLNNPAAPVTLSSVSMQPYGGITGLAVKPGLLAVASPDSIEQNPGRVIFFDTLGNYKGQVTVGSLPDMITFTPDGKFLLTANEGQPNTDFSNDPEGSVSIINVQDTNYVQSDVTTLTFTGYNAIATTLIASGVRKGSTIGTLSQNLEPEYITVSSDNTKAWVTLQENNAIAQIDLVNKIVTNLMPMGMKNHQTAQNGFDASDNNGVVLMTNWPVKSYYMPDGIAQFTVGTTTYLITANEGDEREYAALNERTTVGAVTLDATRFPNGAMLKETHALGRLRITNQSGDLDGDGDYDELHMVGPRSFTIYNAATGAQVYESKNLIESIVLADPTWGPFFNADSENNTRKNRSRAKGPEPEGVAVGKIGSRTFAFIALERVGGVMAFEVTNPAAPVFSGYLNTRSATSLAGDRGAEVVQFLSHEQSPNGQPMLLVANEISGTLAIYQVGMGYNVLNGRLNYANAQATVMAGDTLRLVNTGGQVIASTTTGTDGRFSLENFAAGTYQIRGNSNRTWGGVNSTDALEARRIYQGLLLPTPIVSLAADVNSTALVNNTDALMIIRRANAAISSFPAGNWQYSGGSLDFSSGRLLNASVLGLASGDVNASYFGLPGGRLSIPRLVATQEPIAVQKGRTAYTLPVRAAVAMDMGALSLDMPWPAGLELLSVKSKLGEEALLHHMSEGRLRMGWTSTEGFEVRPGDVLFEMEVSVEGEKEIDFASITLGLMSEIADPMAQPLYDATLMMPRLTANTQAVTDLQAWPNPANDALNLHLTLQAGIQSWSVELVDALGRVVASELSTLPGSTLQTRLSLEGLASGSYQVRVRLNDASGTTSSLMRRIQVQR